MKEKEGMPPKGKRSLCLVPSELTSQDKLTELCPNRKVASIVFKFSETHSYPRDSTENVYHSGQT